MPISRPEIRPLERHVTPDSPPPILRFEIETVITQDSEWAAKRLKAVAGGGLAKTGKVLKLHRTAGSVTLNIGDRGWMIWKRDSRRFEVLTSAAGTGIRVVRFELSTTHTQNSTTPVEAVIVVWDGAAYVATGDNIWVVDSIGEWGKADETFQGWGVQIGDRTIFDDGTPDERAVYEIIFLESFARFGEATLDEDMGETTADEAAATPTTEGDVQWGAAPNHHDHEGTITIKDRFKFGGCLKSGDNVWWVWNEVQDSYYLLAPQELGRVKVRDEDPCDFLEDQMENETQFDAGITQKPKQTSRALVFTDVFNYSLPNTLEDNWKIRDYVDWTVVDTYLAAYDQVLVHAGSDNVSWCTIEQKTVITDVRINSTTNPPQIVVDEMDIFVIKPENIRIGRIIHLGTECPP
jgi:hypothetical protein